MELSSSSKPSNATLGKKKHICSQAFFLSLSSNQNLISFPVPPHCRQCLCSFYYLSCCGKGNSAPLVNHASLRNISSVLPSPSARIQADWAGREADSSCKPQKDAFLSHPYLSFSDFSWLAPPWCVLTQPLLSAAGVGAIWSHHHSVMDGVTGDATPTPAYLSVPGYPNLDTFSPL